MVSPSQEFSSRPPSTCETLGGLDPVTSRPCKVLGILWEDVPSSDDGELEVAPTSRLEALRTIDRLS